MSRVYVTRTANVRIAGNNPVRASVRRMLRSAASSPGRNTRVRSHPTQSLGYGKTKFWH